MHFIKPNEKETLKYKGKPVVPIIVLSITLSVYFVCIFILSRWYVQRLKINYLANDILESTKIIEDEEPKEVIKQEYTTITDNKYANISF